jgi:hypothetical protein
VCLTTFRRNGIGVPTTVWIARDGDELIVTTPAASGKVKRVRNNAGVTLRPSSRLGSVDPAAPLVVATARIARHPAEIARCSSVFEDKYGGEYRAFLAMEHRFAGGRQARVILRLSD